MTQGQQPPLSPSALPDRCPPSHPFPVPPPMSPAPPCPLSVSPTSPPMSPDHLTLSHVTSSFVTQPCVTSSATPEATTVGTGTGCSGDTAATTHPQGHRVALGPHGVLSVSPGTCPVSSRVPPAMSPAQCPPHQAHTHSVPSASPLTAAPDPGHCPREQMGAACHLGHQAGDSVTMSPPAPHLGQGH